jgi:hypothetical protein
LKDSLLGDPHNNLLKKTVRELAAQHKPIIFVGDGLSKQNAEALLCEAMRSEVGVVVGGRATALEANYTLQWRRSPLRLDVSYLRLTSLYERKRDRRRHRRGGSEPAVQTAAQIQAVAQAQAEQEAKFKEEEARRHHHIQVLHVLLNPTYFCYYLLNPNYSTHTERLRTPRRGQHNRGHIQRSQPNPNPSARARAQHINTKQRHRAGSQRRSVVQLTR